MLTVEVHQGPQFEMFFQFTPFLKKEKTEIDIVDPHFFALGETHLRFSSVVDKQKKNVPYKTHINLFIPKSAKERILHCKDLLRQSPIIFLVSDVYSVL